MDKTNFILTCLIVIVGAISLNENIKINLILNNIFTRTIVLVLLVHFGNYLK